MLAALTFAHLLSTCAPGIGSVTMRALVAYESGNHPFAIGDNTTRLSYAPASKAVATELAAHLLQLGHSIDVGYAQIDSANFADLGLTVDTVFEPCTNIAAGADILRAAYARSAAAFGPGQRALAHALSIYNSGSEWRGLDYARAVFLTARATP